MRTDHGLLETCVRPQNHPRRALTTRSCTFRIREGFAADCTAYPTFVPVAPVELPSTML